MMLNIARKNLRLTLRAGLLLSALALTAPAHAVGTIGDIDLTSLSGTYLAARTADSGKDIANAAALYQAAHETDPDNLFLLERALVLTAAAGDVDEAVVFAERLMESAPDSHPARLVLAVEAMGSGEYAKAEDLLGEDGAGVLADLASGLLRAWALFGQGEAQAALNELEALDGEEWYEPFKLLHAGYIALASGRTEEALELLADAREADPNAVRINEAYARALVVAGREEDAEAALTDFLERFPDNPLAIRALEEVRSEEAASGTVAMPAEGAAEALAGLGAAVGQEGGLEIASLYLRLALHLDDDIGGGIGALSLGTLLDANEQGEAAIEVYESIAPDAAFRGLGALRAAMALDRMDRTEEAEAAFKEAVERNPEDIQAYISYGNMLRGRERFADAARVYGEAIERIGEPGETDWSLFYFRGIAYERVKEWEKAEVDFRKALELYPDQPLVLNYLGYSWIDMGINLEEGMEMIRKAVELRPNDGYIVDSLGWAHYRLGEYEDAVRELERAVALRPEDPVINDHLGDAYWKTGRTLEAQFQWRHARDFGAEGEELELILKKIAEGRLIEKPQDAALNTAEPG